MWLYYLKETLVPFKKTNYFNKNNKGKCVEKYMYKSKDIIDLVSLITK